MSVAKSLWFAFYLVVTAVASPADEMEASSHNAGRVTPQLRGTLSFLPLDGPRSEVGSSPVLGPSAEELGPVFSLSEPPKITDLSDIVLLQGGYAPGGFQQGGFQQQGGYRQGVQPGSYSQGASGHGSGSSPILVSLVVTVLVLVCACCCVIQLVRCMYGEVCGGDLDPMLGAGAGALAGYEMGQYMDGGYGQQPMY